MCLMVMKHSIPQIIMGVMPDKVNARSFIVEVVNRFIKSDKVETIVLFGKLIHVRYDGK